MLSRPAIDETPIDRGSGAGGASLVAADGVVKRDATYVLPTDAFLALALGVHDERPGASDKIVSPFPLTLTAGSGVVRFPPGTRWSQMGRKMVSTSPLRNTEKVDRRSSVSKISKMILCARGENCRNSD